MAIADKLARMLQTKTEIRAAIEEKGQTVGDDLPFSGYPDKIRAIETVEAVEGPLDPETVYKTTRPKDWMPLPSKCPEVIYSDVNNIYFLCLIPEGASSTLSFTAETSTAGRPYYVKIGRMENGEFVEQSSTEVESGATYSAELLADDFQVVTADGYKQAIIWVTGRTVTRWVAKKGSGIVDIRGGGTLKEFTCSGLVNLRYAYIPSMSSGIEKLQRMFFGCVSLIAVMGVISSFFVESLDSMFSGCRSLIALPRLSIARAKNVAGLFSNCSALHAIPALKLDGATNISSLFNGCSALRSVPGLWAPSATAATKLCYGCSALTAITDLHLPQVAALRYNSEFYGCSALERVTFAEEAAEWSLATVSLLGFSLGHAALVNLINSLPPGTEGATLTLTRNPGVAELTEEEIAVATAKGWTVTT